jgi:2,3-bisphosphoglycerate-independent phosphoglycerate mutase
MKASTAKKLKFLLDDILLRSNTMMATTEERMKILQMIQDGKISAEDGAKLLAAISENDKPQKSASLQRARESRYMRVRVTEVASGKTKVSVNLPLGLVDAGLNIASNFMPDMGKDAASEISAAINEGLTGKIVDVMDEDGEHIEIFIE